MLEIRGPQPSSHSDQPASDRLGTQSRCRVFPSQMSGEVLVHFDPLTKRL